MTKNIGGVLAQPVAAPDQKFEITSDSVNVAHTDWGYVIGPGRTAAKRAKTGEDIATAGCLVFGGIAIAQWVLPNSQVGMEVMTFKLAVTLVFFFIALKLFLIARSGLLRETQVDMEEREIRKVRRSRRRVSGTLAAVKFRDVGKVYIMRVPGGFMHYNLYVKPIGKAQPVLIAAGPERLMEEMRSNLLSNVRSRGQTQRPDPIIR